MVSIPPSFDIRNPFHFKEYYWPQINFYKEQTEIIESVWHNDRTFVRAGNKLGKDFVAGFIPIWFLMTRKPCRIVTTSAKDDHLRVLWGEINRFIQTARFPLTRDKGGPLIVNHQDIRIVRNGKKCPISYCIGMVASEDSIAAMQGHHANPETLEDANDEMPRTLFMSDESSSVPSSYYMMATTWAQRILAFGNPWDCHNFFREANDEGDIPREIWDHRRGMYHKILRIRAQDSPNVRRGLAQEAKGIIPDNKLIVPGVKTYLEYKNDRKHLNEIEQCVKLDAEFYKGKESLMFPPVWLNRAATFAESIRKKPRQARAIGCDPAEGGDKTSMAAVDEFGLIELVSKKTPDTNIIPGELLAFMFKHGVAPENVAIDRGGGGKEHADRIRAMGFPIRTIAFGESPSIDPRHSKIHPKERLGMKEERAAYKNLRAEMYDTLRNLIDPSLQEMDGSPGFAIPAYEKELLRQLRPIPLLHDAEGTKYLLPKNKKSPDSKEKTLTELIGCSPDEADAFVLGIHAMLNKPHRSKVGAF